MMLTLNHPSASVDASLLTTLRRYAREAEVQKQLHPEQLKLIYEQQWFNMYVPHYLGGLNYSLPEILRIEEALAWADGSVAWVVTLCSGAAWFAGFLDTALAKEIFSNPTTCVAGSGATTGIAELSKDGYVVHGKWKYASGAMHATMFTTNCVIMDNGRPVIQKDGTPLIKSFIFHKEEVQLEQSWSTMGMIATGSHGYTISNVHVPHTRAFTIDQTHTTLMDPIFKYPFLQLAEATLAVNLSGMAQQFLDLCAPLFKERMSRAKHARVDLQVMVTAENEKLSRHRAAFYHAVHSSWEYCNDGQIIPEALLVAVSETSRALYTTAIEVVDKLYPFAGLVATNPHEEINRVWRNLHTASQHTLFTLR